MKTNLERILQRYRTQPAPVVDFNPATDRLFPFNFSASNPALNKPMIADTAHLSKYVTDTLQAAGCRYGIGGYNEDRILYQRSELFESGEPRTVHLGIDIWGPAGTKVYAPLGGTVHSFAFNDHFGDYGATIILQHQLDSLLFHTLYGHLSVADLDGLTEGRYISRGEVLAHFGPPEENGNWPPHLHFQIIEDMRIKRGDYPGVCKASERTVYLSNCPDPDYLLNMNRYL